MSEAALKLVNACTHPHVKGATRKLFEAIADHIPEGQTTTPPMTLPDLAHAAQHTGRTAQTARNRLEDLHLIQVHEGGRGNKARYEVLRLEGARPVMPVPLPLRADLREAPRTKEERSTSDPTLGDRTIKERSTSDPMYEQTAINVGNFFLRCWSPFVNVGNFFLRWQIRTIKQRSTSDPTFAAALPLPLDVAVAVDVAGTRARDVQQLLRTTTTTAAPLAAAATPPRPGGRPCRWAGTSHAWCAGRVHVPRDFHFEERRKLARRPGETEADLDAQLFARYAQVLAAIPDTQELPRETEFTFWKRMLRSAPSGTVPKVRASTEARRFSGAPGGSMTCDHEPKCETRHACIERTLADGRAERERQTG